MTVGHIHIGVVNIGTPEANLGLAITGSAVAEGTDIDLCLKALAAALRSSPLALGFEAPMLVPIRTEPVLVTAARKGEIGAGMPSKPFSAGTGAAVLETALVAVPYLLMVCVTGLEPALWAVGNGVPVPNWATPLYLVDLIKIGDAGRAKSSSGWEWLKPPRLDHAGRYGTSERLISTAPAWNIRRQSFTNWGALS